MDSNQRLIIKNPSKSTFCRLAVSKEVAQRAKADPAFASMLLRNALAPQPTSLLRDTPTTATRKTTSTPLASNAVNSFGTVQQVVVSNVIDERLDDASVNGVSTTAVGARNVRVNKKDIVHSSNENMGDSTTASMEDENANKEVKSSQSTTIDVPASTTHPHAWHYKEVVELIASYGTHAEEFKHPVKRRHAWENICNDLLSAGFSVTPAQCTHKWSNLLRSYKVAKDSTKDKNSTGRARSRFQFLDSMDSVIGRKPSNSDGVHTMSSLKKNDHDLKDSRVENYCSSQGSFDDNKENCNESLCWKRKSIREIERDRKQARHDAMVSIEKEKLEVEKTKLNLLDKYLKLKESQK